MAFKERLKNQTFVITRSWFNDAIETLQGQIDRKEIKPGWARPFVKELKRIRAEWLDDQAAAGNV